MPSIKLTYFNIRGRAELARLILAQAGANYEDCRLDKEKWMSLKPTTPTGQLPILEYDGKVISQSLTIARFLAKEFGLAGKTNMDRAQADMVVDTLGDVTNAMSHAHHAPNEEEKQRLLEEMKTKTFPALLTNLEKILKAQGGKHFAGNELTYADIAVALALKTATDRRGREMIANFKLLSDLMDRVNNLPNIKKWIETRPQSEM